MTNPEFWMLFKPKRYENQTEKCIPKKEIPVRYRDHFGYKTMVPKAGLEPARLLATTPSRYFYNKIK